MRAKLPRISWLFPTFLTISVLIPAALAPTRSSPHWWRTSGPVSPQNRLATLIRPHLPSPATHPTPDHNLVFDPVLVYATYLGGPSSINAPFFITQSANVILTDSAGNLYVGGFTTSKGFPVTPSVVEPNNSQKNQLGFLAKLDPTGQSLIFSTYIDGISQVSAMALDANGDIYVAGPATIPGLPIPAGSIPFQATPSSIGILKLNSTATILLAATYLGGSASNAVTGLAVEPGNGSSNLYVTGSTTSNDFPTQAPLQASLGSTNNAFVTVLNPTLSAAVYSTYLGQTSSAGSGTGPHAIAVDTAGNAYVVGQATPGFPTTAGAIQATCPDGCAYLAKLNPAGSALVYSTYLGSGSASANAVAVDSSKNVYLEGSAPLSSSITEVHPVPGFFPCATPNSSVGFVSEISASGSLAFSTCVVGSSSTIALDGSGNISITGYTNTGFLPLKNPIQSNAPDTGAPFVATINPNTGSLLFSSFLGDGQGGNPSINDIAVDSADNVYAAGYGNDSPIFNALQPVPAGGDPPCPEVAACENGSNVDILKIAPTNAAAAGLSPAALTFPAQAVGTLSAPQSVNVIDLGSSPLTVSNATTTGDFSVQDGCTAAVASSGGTCALQVTFTPAALGTRTGTLTIADSSAGSPRTVQLTGQGAQASVAVSPVNLFFSVQQPGTTSSSQPVTLSNSGALALQISNVQITGPFAETNNCGSSVPATVGTCTINVTFSPTVAGAASGTLSVSDNSSGSPHTVALAGTGGTPSLGLGFAPSNGPLDLTAGSTATTVLGIGGAGIGGTVTLTCSGAPTGATCSLSPSTLQVSATSASRVGLTVATTARSHILFVPPNLAPWLWLVSMLGCLILLRAASANRRLRWRFVPLMALAICACGGGSGGGGGGTPAGSYTIVVTAKSGSTTQSFSVPLTVQ